LSAGSPPFYREFVPDKRAHRGPHPEDARLFAPPAWPALRSAVADLSWLYDRGYAAASSLKLVGDRHELTQRQRIAVGRCAASSEAVRGRMSRQVEPRALSGETVWLDGYNVLTTVEAALSGGVLLLGRDGCLRDMASMHGSYRKVSETLPALRLVSEWLKAHGAASCHWLLDKPVSNSGQLKKLIEDVLREAGSTGEVVLVNNPDAPLSQTDAVVASSDSVILGRCQRWLDLARLVVESGVPGARLIDLASTA
jgi:hypothetical protein